MQVFPPRSSIQPSVSTSHSALNGQAAASSSSTSSSSLSDEQDMIPIHKVAEDLKVSVADSIARDDPQKYYYKIQILEEDKSHGGKGSGSTAGSKGKETGKSKYSGSLMDVKCSDMRYVSPFLPAQPLAHLYLYPMYLLKS